MANIEDPIEDNVQTNIKFFWKYVNSLKKKNNTNIPDIVSYNGILSSNDQEKVQFFANYFSTVYVKPTNLNTTTSTLYSNNNLNLHVWSISEHEIYEHLNSLDIHTGSGPDGVPPLCS